MMKVAETELGVGGQGRARTLRDLTDAALTLPILGKGKSLNILLNGWGHSAKHLQPKVNLTDCVGQR